MVYYLQIDGLRNPNDFIEKWSKVYIYKNEHKYNDNIEKGLDSDGALEALMGWKNGTGEKISGKKTKKVDEFKAHRDGLNKLKNNFSFSQFEKELKPEKDSSIWKIFLLHIINPAAYPIFDQHVYRSFEFFRSGKIVELSKTNHKQVYSIYKEEYLPWFNELKTKYSIEPRKIDKALFAFGRVLKTLRDTPIEIKY